MHVQLVIKPNTNMKNKQSDNGSGNFFNLYLFQIRIIQGILLYRLEIQ